MSVRSFRRAIRTKWMIQAPAIQSALHTLPICLMKLCTFCIHPFGIQIREGRLITYMLQALWWLTVHEATRPPSPPLFHVEVVRAHDFSRRMLTEMRWSVYVSSKGQACPLYDYRRQLGGFTGDAFCWPLRCKAVFCCFGA